MRKHKKNYEELSDEDDWSYKISEKKSSIKKPKRKNYYPRQYKKGRRKVFCCRTLDENVTEDELLKVMKQNKWTLQDEILGENDEHVYVFSKWE